MGIFGLGDSDDKAVKKTEDKKADTKAEKKPAGNTGGQSDEAKEILAKMEAKKDAGDCAFC